MVKPGLPTYRASSTERGLGKRVELLASWSVFLKMGSSPPKKKEREETTKTQFEKPPGLFWIGLFLIAVAEGREDLFLLLTWTETC